MHDRIKRFSLNGIILPELAVQTRERLIINIESDMRDQGYVPVLDLTPQFTRVYDAVKEHFEFDLSVYGVYVGKDEEWQIAGMTDGKLVERHIPSHKSSQFLNE